MAEDEEAAEDDKGTKKVEKVIRLANNGPWGAAVRHFTHTRILAGTIPARSFRSTSSKDNLQRLIIVKKADCSCTFDIYLVYSTHSALFSQ